MSDTKEYLYLARLIPFKRAATATLNEADVECLRTFAKNNMNESATAKEMYCHRNTVKYHIERIRHITGLDPKRFYDLVKLISMFEGECHDGTGSN